MYCVPEYKIGLIGSSFLIGMVIGCMTVTRLGDVYGRKPIFMFGMGLSVIMIVILIFTTNYIMVYFLVFFFGIATTGKTFVGFTYMLEL